MESYADPKNEALLKGEPKIIVDNKEEELKYRKGECSWCHSETDHVRLSKNLAKRNKYQCTHCYRNTVKCRANHCTKMARAHRGWKDDLCIDHHKCYNEEALLAYCSWCFKLTLHEIFMDNAVNAITRMDKVFYCNSCFRPTKKCKKCDQNMARLSGLMATSQCFYCCDLITDFSDPEVCVKETSLISWCPWCIHRSEHTLFDHNKGKLRDTYACNNCTLETIPCSHCGRAMAKSSPIKFRCYLCKHKEDENYYVSLNSKFQTQVDLYNREYAEYQLHRDSVFRTRAQDEGLIKPFLLLIAMHPEMRAGVAYQLRLLLLKHDEISGDPHAEADVILFHKKKGIRRRSDTVLENIGIVHKANWYQILHRAIKDVSGYSTFHSLNSKKIIPEAENPSSELVAALETELLDVVARRHLYLLPHHLKEKASEIYESPSVYALFDPARKEGINSSAMFLLFICIIISMNIKDFSDANALTALNVDTFMQYLNDYFLTRNATASHLETAENLAEKVAMSFSKKLILKVVSAVLAAMLLPSIVPLLLAVAPFITIPISILVYFNKGSREISCPAVVMITLQNFLLPTEEN